MCGFVGIVSKSGREFPEETLRRMTGMIVHRGPDDEGYFTKPGWLSLGFRRLSILDLSPLGHQPMLSHDGNLAIVYNGEIYNYQELRKELEPGYPFKSHTDTEVILAAYLKWGKDCVRRFTGMFAFVLADLGKKEIFAARDQLGIKPLLLFEDRDFLVFCSEAKSLLPYTNLQPNYASFDEYLVFRSVLNRETMFQNVASLPPGRRLSITADGRRAEEEYFTLASTLETNNARSFQESCDEVERTLRESVRIHLRSDVELGVQLSGGVDSSLITALASQELGRRVHSFSVSFAEAGYDESKYQKMVSDRYNTEHHDFRIDNRTFTDEIINTIWHYEHPLNDPNAVSTLHLMREVKKHITVILAGEGADESFMGYMRFTPESVAILKRRTFLHRHDLLRRALLALWPVEKGKSLLSITKYNPAMYVPSYNDLNSVDLLLDGDDSSIRFRRAAVALAKGDVLNEAILQDEICDLPQWFQRADRMGMAASVEVRVPFCTEPMFRLANSIPYEQRVHNGDLKAVLKTIAERYLDHELIHRKKIGFGTPLDAWSESTDGWGGLQRNIFDSKIFKSREFIDWKHFNSFYEPFKTGSYKEVRCGWLWTYCNLELWHRLFFEGGWRRL